MLQGDSGHISISLNSPNHSFALNPVVLKPTFNIPVSFGGLRKGAVASTDVANAGVLSRVMISSVPGPALGGTGSPTCSTEPLHVRKQREFFGAETLM